MRIVIFILFILTDLLFVMGSIGEKDNKLKGNYIAATCCMSAIILFLLKLFQ